MQLRMLVWLASMQLRVLVVSSINATESVSGG